MSSSFSGKLKNRLPFQALLRSWNKVLLTLACIVVCVTSYALILPALTLNGDYVCGKEAHTHGAACYAVGENGEPVLICTREEHQHDEYCLVQEKDPRAYICGHAYEHVHEDGCWCDGVLVCTLTEHTHDASCLPPEYQTETGAASEGETLGSVTAAEAKLLQQANSDGTLVLLDENGEPYAPEEDGGALLTLETPEALKPLIQLRREAALEANNTRVLDQLDRSGAEGLPFEVDPDDEYVALDSLTDATISFSIYNSATNEPVDPSLIHGGGYSFTLTAASNSGGVLLENYILYGLVYYYKVHCPDFQLYMTQNDVSVPLEQYAADWVNINSAEMSVVRDSSGNYWFRFRTANYSTVNRVSVTGFLVSDREVTSMSLSKSAQWDMEELAYEYTIRATIPHAVNNNSQYYYLEDNTTLSISGGYYNGFAENADGDFSVSLSNGSGSETQLLPIQEAADNSNVSLAYYLEPSSGRLYLLNRTTHSGAHQVNPVPGVLQQYPGWCFCWEQTVDYTLIVRYVDTEGQHYFSQASAESFLNRAYLRDQNGSFVVADASPNAMSGLLKKSYSSTDKTFTIIFNDDFLDLSSRQSEALLDVMLNCVLPADQSPTVSKRTSREGELIPLTLGSDYSFERTADGFSITLYDLGPYQYLITYPVALAEGATSTEIGNTVSIAGTGVSKSITTDYGSSGSSAESSGWLYVFTLLKTYDEGNPPLGADFGLYRASDDTLIAHSVVEETGGDSDSLQRKIYFYRGSREIFVPMPDGSQILYTPGNAYDEVVFHSAGLALNTLYYVQELAPPEDYDGCTRRFYFYAADPYNATPPPEGASELIENGESVTVLNNWRQITISGSLIDYADKEAEERCHNSKIYVNLPATGGHGAVWIYLAGSALALSPLVLVLKKLRRRRCE